MSAVQLRKIWKAGVDLSDAWLHYAADPAPAMSNRLSGALAHLRSVVQSTRDGKLILSALQTAGKANLEEMASRKPLQDALLKTLASDRLMATGYSDMPAAGATPVVIDPETIAAAHPDWENSRIRVNGTLYEKVRITDPAALDAKPDIDAPSTFDNDSIEPVKVLLHTGARDVIQSALDQIVAQEAAFGNMRRKDAAQIIRERIGQSYEKGNGLSDPNLSRYIRRTCGPKTVRKAN